MSLRPLLVSSFLALIAGLALVGSLSPIAGCTPNIGNKCTISTDCSQLGDRLCDTNQPDGYCTAFNCEPDQCPNSICVAFDPTLDPVCGSDDNGRAPRYQQTFCLAPCSSNSDCRDQYQCVDLSLPENQIARSAQVVDLGAGDGGLGYGVCMASTCADAIHDGAETDVDCGGPDCKLCADRQHCGSGSDCASNVCVCTSKACVSNTCVDPTCTNGRLDPGETDVDCGGPLCLPCTNQQSCTTNTDCASNSCVSSKCAPGDCTDGIKDFQETDVDCGGPLCPSCGTGRICAGGSDCATGNCNGQCVIAVACQRDSDCPTGSCVVSVGKCAAGRACSDDTECAGGAAGSCAKQCGYETPPPICSVTDAGFPTDGAPPWTSYTPPDAGDGG
jgi:hypothetical protein